MVNINNQILQSEYDKAIKVKAPLNDEERGEWKISKKTYGECIQKHLLNQQWSVHSCLQDKMHNNEKWEKINKIQKPLKLYTLIKRVKLMKKTGEEYPLCNVVDNLLSVLLMKKQQNMSNAQ